jgi:hypothetical protein
VPRRLNGFSRRKDSAENYPAGMGQFQTSFVAERMLCSIMKDSAFFDNLIMISVGATAFKQCIPKSATRHDETKP